MKLVNLFKRKRTTVNLLLQSDLCKKILNEFCEEDLTQTTALIIVYETQKGDKQETYWKCAGMEPAQAILILDQLHHRIQHEGLVNYD